MSHVPAVANVCLFTDSPQASSVFFSRMLSWEDSSAVSHHNESTSPRKPANIVDVSSTTPHDDDDDDDDDGEPRGI